MERAIVEALKSAYGNRNIKFQVVIQNRQLDIYLNHRRDDRPNYLLLEETVAATIASLDLAAIDGVRLYCRPQGQITPDWETSIEFQQSVNTDDIETIGTTESQIIADNLSTIELSSPSTTENYPIYPIASDPNAITDLEVQTEWERHLAPENDSDSNSFDTGLLHHAGLTHSSSLEETEIDSVFNAVDLQAGIFPPASDNELARYCFVANRQLLTSDTIPGKEIVRLIKFFHHLGDRNQLKLLPILTTYFQQGTTHDLDFSPAVQKWFKQIKELDYDDHQMLAIWLSRYCFSPDATLEEFKAINARQAEKVKTKQADYRGQASSFPPVKTEPQRSQPKPTPLSKPSRRFSFKKLLLPTAWILATVILLIVAIADRSPNSTTADRIPTLCNDTIGSPDYCRLAVNLAGTKAIARSPQSPYPLTQLTETVATYGCQRYANLKAEIAPDLTLEQTPAKFSYSEKVFSHIYVVRVEQKNAQREGTTQVGCVYTTGRGQRSPKLLAADVIPTNWPTEPYQNQVEANFGNYIPLNFGLYTIFAAIGIAIASWLNLGIKINRAATIYLAALVLGITQLLAAAVPVFSPLAKVILPIFAIFALNQSLKGFQVSHRHGVAAIAIGILTIILVQLSLYGLFLGSIGSLL